MSVWTLYGCSICLLHHSHHCADCGCCAVLSDAFPLAPASEECMTCSVALDLTSDAHEQQITDNATMESGIMMHILLAMHRHCLIHTFWQLAMHSHCLTYSSQQLSMKMPVKLQARPATTLLVWHIYHVMSQHSIHYMTLVDSDCRMY